MGEATLLCWPDAAVRAVDDGVVETAVRLPVETLPQWWRCPRCGARGLGGQVTHCWGDLAKGTDHDLVPVLPDGPFPLRVAVATTEHRERWPGHPEAGRGMGPAIIAVGTITEDGHHADECRSVDRSQGGDEPLIVWRCSPHVGPGTYHYRLSDVVRFDTPIPAERHYIDLTEPTPGHEDCGCGATLGRATWQVVDDDLAARIDSAVKEAADG